MFSKERVILHSDLNSFYASVECLYRPEIRQLPVAVCGSQEDRHGIVLASNIIAKKYGIKTGEVVWQAQQKCPNLFIVPPNFRRYLSHSYAARNIYKDYTPYIEAFGIDENWLDVSGSVHLFGSGEKIAYEIKERIKAELGVTVSIGVSYNKIFAKLGSDMKKPDAVTVITKENYKDKVWVLPVSDLLFVGRQTTKKLNNYGIYTIGDLATVNPEWLKKKLGINGYKLWQYANGLDLSQVNPKDYKPEPKSIGNSTTTPKDMETFQQIHITVYNLSESVAERMRKQELKCETIQVSLRYTDLSRFERQKKLQHPASTSYTICKVAMDLIEENWNGAPLRSVGVRATDLTVDEFEQMCFLPEIKREQQLERIESTVQELRGKYGNKVVQRGLMLVDTDLSKLDAQKEATPQTIAFMR